MRKLWFIEEAGKSGKAGWKILKISLDSNEITSTLKALNNQRGSLFMRQEEVFLSKSRVPASSVRRVLVRCFVVVLYLFFGVLFSTTSLGARHFEIVNERAILKPRSSAEKDFKPSLEAQFRVDADMPSGKCYARLYLFEGSGRQHGRAITPVPVRYGDINPTLFNFCNVPTQNSEEP
jgi:hypothetical protein